MRPGSGNGTAGRLPRWTEATPWQMTGAGTWHHRSGSGDLDPCCRRQGRRLRSADCHRLPAGAKETVSCQLTGTPRAGAGFVARTGWKHSATACRYSPPRCWYWISRFIRRDCPGRRLSVVLRCWPLTVGVAVLACGPGFAGSGSGWRKDVITLARAGSDCPSGQRMRTRPRSSRVRTGSCPCNRRWMCAGAIAYPPGARETGHVRAQYCGPAAVRIMCRTDVGDPVPQDMQDRAGRADRVRQAARDGPKPGGSPTRPTRVAAGR